MIFLFKLGISACLHDSDILYVHVQEALSMKMDRSSWTYSITFCMKSVLFAFSVSWEFLHDGDIGDYACIRCKFLFFDNVNECRGYSTYIVK